MDTTRKLFGTDGIRGLANRHPMTPELALSLGRAAGLAFRTGEHRHTVIIGKDTRLSGYMFESALQAGFTSMGVHCHLVGPMPTPAIAFLTRALRADAGVVISASHNPYYDNGIKFFGPNGMKLPDSREAEIEALMADAALDHRLPLSDQLGRARRIEDAAGRYIEFCKNSFSRSLRLSGLRVVVDCAHGAAYKIAPDVFWELGAEVICLGVNPNGVNINDGCGALYPKAMQEKVREVRADVGIALDGDADRLIACDEHGHLLDGDRLLAMSALAMKEAGGLQGGGVVGTVMANLGFERHLQHHGLHLVRAKVGDRYVLEQMVQEGYNLGGEQSGHLIYLDHNTTGDGIISALKVLERMAATGEPLSRLAGGWEPMPQVLRNLPIAPGSDPMKKEPVQEAVAAAEAGLGQRGRVLVRKSGTEPLVRVMVEGEDEGEIERVADALCQIIGREAGQGGR